MEATSRTSLLSVAGKGDHQGRIDGLLKTTFGDEHSSLFDQFERRSIELQIDRVVLGRSSSESKMVRSYFAPASPPRPPPPPIELWRAIHKEEVRQGKRMSVSKVLKKLFRPVFGVGRKGEARRGIREAKVKEEERNCHPLQWKTLSRSLRF